MAGKTEIELIGTLNDAQSWLESAQGSRAEGFQATALEDFRAFVAGIKADPSPAGIARASEILGRKIADFDWESHYCQQISSFNNRFWEIRKSMERGTTANALSGE